MPVAPAVTMQAVATLIRHGVGGGRSEIQVVRITARVAGAVAQARHFTGEGIDRLCSSVSAGWVIWHSVGPFRVRWRTSTCKNSK